MISWFGKTKVNNVIQLIWLNLIHSNYAVVQNLENKLHIVNFVYLAEELTLIKVDLELKWFKIVINFLNIKSLVSIVWEMLLRIIKVLLLFVVLARMIVIFVQVVQHKVPLFHVFSMI